MVLFGLVFSAFSSLAMGSSEICAPSSCSRRRGFPLDISGRPRAPWWPISCRRSSGRGFRRAEVAGNLAWIFANDRRLVATRSFLLLFVLDAICSTITASSSTG